MGKREWNVGNESSRNDVVFGVNNVLSSHTGNRKNHFLVLGEGDTFVLIESLVDQKKL